MIQVGDVLAAIEDAEVVRKNAEQFSRASVDTRDITGGELFVAIPGPSRDGHDFVAAAVRSGATGALVSRDLAEVPDLADLDITVIRVPDTLIALQQAAAHARARSTASVVAVTGSAGKTTAKTLIAQVLQSKFEILANKASFNNHLGVPLTLTAIEPTQTQVISEIGTNHPGEIGHLAGLVAPDVSVVTNVGFAHLGNFADQQELANEKTDIFNHTRPGGVWIINGDDQLLTSTTLALPGAAQATVVRVGFDEGNDLRAVDVTVDEHGTRGVIEVDGQSLPFGTGAAGRHFGYAAMLAVAVGRVYDIAPSESIEALRGVQPPAGRASLRRIDDDLLMIDDSYNGSPDAMISSLDLLGSLPGGVKVAVLGQMGELGQFSHELHSRVGRKAATSVTHLVTVGEAAAPLRESAADGGVPVADIYPVSSAREAFAQVKDILDASSEPAVVLAKGSRAMHMERVYLGLAGHTVACALTSCPLYINCADCPKLTTG
ncbi:UDP-N-acetylmuramoyl-tripeptide--D-alanyl-D-alanine ligase [Kineosporia sp. NBRC 101731]|uniref:UDP-N-acetylmuramoyl-tripeptide--D-alanyl-D- alanine ligase n=1 Tax=Kineosporia sp. NBRC 101731 TaxID=3032199 RepID=UPI0024A2D173|nr:UDP-N-acetylmuramoyl-tripeptide--D-alanyl-D-alanine ligase [Kineosporia sp. NBRC 101731]GLY26938.1 UDP-N-acetylmuramoyl-tripeptide--D-alanyl-D-alanine ligase [Kineosporia sp. NBRC 101731]